MIEKYGLWPESEGYDPGIDTGKAARIAIGVDVGTTSTQAAVLADDKLLAWSSIRTGADFGAAAESAATRALSQTGLTLSDAAVVTATGFGSRNAGFAAQTRGEVLCHAKGARFLFGPAVHTVVDLGGQHTTAIALYDWDRVRSFCVNDKCATGMGRNIEIVSELLQVPITEIGAKSLDVTSDPEPVSTTCSNFAYPETIGLLRGGYKEQRFSEEEVLAAYLFAIVWRILGTIGKLAPLDIGEIKLEEGIAFTGGLARNEGITKRLERELKLTALTAAADPQLAGAIGAALLS
jgi:predicted CoA-substrate-specific enzyme activase